MPKLPGKRFASAESHDVGWIDSVVADENDCLSFERRLNELVDLRCSVSEILTDGHLLVCAHCQMMLEDYQSMLEASELLRGMHVEDTDPGEDLSIDSRGAGALRSLSAASTGSQFFGWSTLLAVLFVFWGASVRGPVRVIEETYPASLATVDVEQAESVHQLNFDELFGGAGVFAKHLLEASPSGRGTPANGQPFFELPSDGLLAAGLPAIDLSSVQTEQFNQLRRYWQHASRLPGFEPWQHSINFAIGWFNQPALPGGKPECI